MALPADLLEAVRLSPGDKVFVTLADDPPGALLVLPVEMIVQWIDQGRARALEAEAAPDTHPGPST